MNASRSFVAKVQLLLFSSIIKPFRRPRPWTEYPRKLIHPYRKERETTQFLSEKPKLTGLLRVVKVVFFSESFTTTLFCSCFSKVCLFVGSLFQKDSTSPLTLTELGSQPVFLCGRIVFWLSVSVIDRCLLSSLLYPLCYISKKKLCQEVLRKINVCNDLGYMLRW